MNKKIESIQKSIDTFREMIKENSSSPIGIRFEGYYELTPRGRYNREHDASFKEIRETMLNNLAKKYDEKYLEEWDSFIIYVTLSGKEEDINRLEKTIEQKKQELEKLERQLNYITEKK